MMTQVTEANTKLKLFYAWDQICFCLVLRSVEYIHYFLLGSGYAKPVRRLRHEKTGEETNWQSGEAGSMEIQNLAEN